MAIPIPRLTVDDYLAADATSETPLEFHDGEIFPMVDASLPHAMLLTSLGGCIVPRLAGTPCRGASLARVRVTASKYVYPDFLIICGQPILASDSDPSLTNPKIIFEILSPSTEGYDYNGKFKLYRQLPSVEEYVLIAQDQPRVEVFRRMPENKWVLSTYEGREAQALLESIPLTLPLAELYA
ncbi:MAG: Uma2 family endonuclease [Acidobacteria bacterium]|nr:Uma2 family endonuclease [Acidobacteriota bacterium]